MTYRRGSEAEANAPTGVPSDFSSPYGREAEASELPGGFVPFGQCTEKVLARAVSAMVLFEICESPIEVILGAELVSTFGLTICRPGEELPADGDLLIPQFKFLRYRIDFALRWDRGKFAFIECDGKEFHSTGLQLARDREKDQAAERSGIPMLRFTGSEIHHSPTNCVETIVRILAGAR